VLVADAQLFQHFVEALAVEDLRGIAGHRAGGKDVQAGDAGVLDGLVERFMAGQDGR
jgi:hypothetical protein